MRTKVNPVWQSLAQHPQNTVTFVGLKLANSNQEAKTMNKSKVAAPRPGDRVTSSQHEGIFEVVGVNSLMQTANLRPVDGNARVIPNVAWTALKSANR
jgi:hypothetical protein